MKPRKRFYKQARAVAVVGGFAVLLDEKPLKTPAGRAMTLASARLAEAVAAEWASQEERIIPSSMPLTQLAATALDRSGPLKDEMVGQLLKYAETDLLCYRAEAPSELAARQEAIWRPVLDWASARLGVELVTVEGVLPMPQPQAALDRLGALVSAYDDWRLTALQAAVAASGSLLLGLALVERRLSAAEAFAASQVDETYQAELWGEDAEALGRRKSLNEDIESAARLLDLCT